MDTSITSLGPFKKRGWVKIHGISLLSYMEKGSGGLQKLREELAVENEGIRVPSAARWLGGAEARTRFRKRRLLRSSVVLAMVGEAAAVPRCALGQAVDGLPESRGEVPRQRGRACAHVVVKCSDCSGPHLSRANVCPVKTEASG